MLRLTIHPLQEDGLTSCTTREMAIKMAKPKISQEEYQEIASLYRSGLSQCDIAKRYGVSHMTIGNILRKIGEETRVGGGQHYQSDLDESNSRILSFLEEGWTYSAIAAHEGISDSSICGRLRVLGFPPTTERTKHPDRAVLYDKIRIAWGFGMEITKIREFLHVSTDTIYKAIGNERKGKGYWNRRKGKVRASQYKALYDTGMSIEDVAELTGAHPSSARRLIKKYFPGTIRKPEKTRALKKRIRQKAANNELMKADHILSNLSIKKKGR